MRKLKQKTRRVGQTLKQDGAFLGLAFSRDGRTLYDSGGNDDSVYCYDWDGHTAALRVPPSPPTHGR